MDENQIVRTFGAALHGYSFDIRNTHKLGPFKGLLTGDATVTCTLKGDKVFFKEATVSEGEVTGLAEKVESLQAENKELKKKVKALEAEKKEVPIVAETAEETEGIEVIMDAPAILDGSDTPKPTTNVTEKLKPRRVKK